MNIFTFVSKCSNFKTFHMVQNFDIDTNMLLFTFYFKVLNLIRECKALLWKEIYNTLCNRLSPNVEKTVI